MSESRQPELPHPPRADAPLPTLGQKLLFWLLLGVTSVIFAEVVSFSAPFPFFDPWGLLVVLPLYTLHLLVLAWVAFRSRRITFGRLFFAGALLGMYEAYITKVLWHPTWSLAELPWTFGGIYVAHTAILVLFWHPLMAFILPLVVAEGLFTSSSETRSLMPKLLRRLAPERALPLGVALLALFCGLYQGSNSPAAAASLLSGAGAALIFYTLSLLWWRRAGKHRYTLRSLLPSRGQGVGLSVLLLALYLILGAVIAPEALPRPPLPHLTVWGIYLLLMGLLRLTRAGQTSHPAKEVSAPPPPLDKGYLWRWSTLFWMLFPLTSAVATLVKPLTYLIAGASWLVGIGVGLLTIARTLLFWREPRPPGRAV
jgi:hypothetical protein